MASTIYFEVFVLIDILLGDVFCDDIVRDITRTTAEVASCPQMSSPELFLQCGNSANRWCAVLPFSHRINLLIVTCGGSEINRCT
jgi:hypothetical protein